MPLLGDSHPSAPKNRAHHLYRVLEAAGLVGSTIEREKWNQILVVVSNATDEKPRERLRRTMESFGMIENHASQGKSGPVEILEDGLALL